MHKWLNTYIVKYYLCTNRYDNRSNCCISNIYFVQMSENDLLKMDAPFWGGVDISRLRARVRVCARGILGHSFIFHIIL